MRKTLMTMMMAALLLPSILLLSACGGSDDNGEVVVKPEAPIGKSDWQTIPTSGGTIEKDDITLVFPSGAFSEEVKVAVTETKADNTVSDDARSHFYQVTLPASGSAMPFTIRLKCDGSTDNVRPVISTPGWNKHEGKVSSMLFDIDATISNGEIIATIPVLEGGDDNTPFFTIGLAECVPDKTSNTRASSSKYTYRVRTSVSDYEKNKDKYSKIRHLISETIPKAHDLLKAQNYKMSSEVSYILVSPKDCDDVKNCWGVFVPAWYGKAWSCVYLNKDRFLEYADNPTTEMENELKQTIIHETSHSVTTLDYDPRSGYEICWAGSKGDDWAQFDEALGCWVEKFTGDKSIGGENTIVNQENFIYEFYPHVRNMSTTMNTGYGMATFIEHLARKSNDQSIIRIYEIFKNGTSSFREVLNTFLKEKNITFFNTDDYYDFAFSVINNKFDSRISYINFFSKQKGISSKTSLQGDVYNYGVLMQQAYFGKEPLKKNIDKCINITQEKEGVITRAYYAKGKNLIEIGQCTAGQTVSISVKDFLEKSGYKSVDDVPSGGSGARPTLYLTTTRQENKDDYSSLDSEIIVDYGDVEETEFKIKEVKVVRLDTKFRTKEKTSGSEEWSYAVGLILNTDDADNFTYSQTNDVVHFEAKMNTNSNDNGWKNESKTVFSFDITGFSGDFKNCRIENLQYTRNELMYYPENYSLNPNLLKYNNDIKCILTEIPLTNSAFYPQWNNVADFTFSGKGTKAFVIKEFSDIKTWSYKNQGDDVENNNSSPNADDEVKLFVEIEYTSKK